MDCLKDFIKFRTLCKDEDFVPSISGRYWEDIPELSVSRINDQTDDKFKNSQDLVDRVLSFAAELVAEEAMMLLSQDGIQFQVANARYTPGCFRISEPYTYNPESPTERGVKFQYLTDDYRSLHLETVTVRTDFTGTKNLKLYEGSLSATPTLYPIDLVVDEQVTISINKQISGTKFWLLMDNTGIKTSHVNLSGYECSHFVYPCEIKAVGWDGAETSEGYGILATVSARCSKESLVCSMKHELRIPILYRAASMIFKELEASERIYVFDIKNEDKLRNLSFDYQKASRDYLEANLQGLRNYVLSLRCPCYICDETRLVTFMP